MPVVPCPNCRKPIDVALELEGQTVVCPLCNGQFMVGKKRAAQVFPPPPPRKTADIEQFLTDLGKQAGRPRRDHPADLDQFLTEKDKQVRRPPADRLQEPAAEWSNNCPFCSEQILATAIKCKHCGSSLLAASPGNSLFPTTEKYEPPNGIVVPLLISAIGNIVASLFWIGLIFTFVLAIPLIILCIFEFSLYSQADGLPPQKLAKKAKTLAIVEIALGFFISLPAFVCGIITLINAGKLARKIRYSTGIPTLIR